MLSGRPAVCVRAANNARRTSTQPHIYIAAAEKLSFGVRLVLTNGSGIPTGGMQAA